MLVAKIRGPISVAAQIALLSLGVSALPLIAKADDADGFVWGIAARETDEAQSLANLVRSGATNQSQGGGVSILATSTGEGVTVAVLDTGIDLDHPEFSGRIVGGTCFLADTLCGAMDGDDDNGHGTHVAGIIAAASDSVGNTGVAPDASLLSVKVLARSGGGAYTAIANGITYAAGEAPIINMSLGGPKPSIVSDYNALVNALKAAAPTSLLVVAAGNNGNGHPPTYPAAFATTPGIVGSMIIAGALAPNGTSMARFSQTPGLEGCVGARRAQTCFKDVFLVAPGQGIYSTYLDGGYTTMNGTSMAAPYISGVAALVLSEAPYLTPQQVANILFTSAIDLGKPGTDPIFGRGKVNATGALQPLGSLSVATSGGSTSGFSGTGNLRVAALGGAMSYGLRASHAAQDVVFFDAFGRDYRANLTQSVRSNAVSLDNALDGSPLRLVSFAGEDFSASALVSNDAGNAVAFAGSKERPSELRNVVVAVRLTDDVSVALGRNADATGRANSLDLAASEAYDGLFMSAAAMNSPYLSFANDASFAAAQLGVGEDLTFAVSHISQESRENTAFTDDVLTREEERARRNMDLTHMASGEGSSAALNWRFASWGIAGVNVTRSSEENALFGGLEAGALALVSDAETTSAGVGVRVNLGGDFVASASWSGGVSRVTPLAAALFNDVSEVRTSAYGVAVAKRGLFGSADTIGFAASRPLHIVNGSAVMTASTDVTEARDIVYTTETINLASATPETDFELGYTALIGNGTFFQANAIYQLDLDGVSGASAIAGLATLKTTW